jgi:hypothetical protein
MVSSLGEKCKMALSNKNIFKKKDGLTMGAIYYS